MGFFEHLEDLRWTLVKSAIAFMVFAVLIGVGLRQFNEILLWPLHTVRSGYPDLTLELGTTSIMEAFTVVIQMCLMGGLLLSAPFILFFIGQFVAPALREEELKLVLPACGAALALFLLGAAFSFFLLVPSTMRVSLEINELFGFTQRWTPSAYYGLVIWLVLGVGAAFEFPLLIVILVKLGMVSVRRLRGWWRQALLVSYIVAALVTPTPDPVTQTMLALPLYGLYWLAILAGSRVERARARPGVEDDL
jgi:sec-independent protein translocase protein TatC